MSENMSDLEKEAFSPKKDESAKEEIKKEIKNADNKKKVVAKEILSWVEVILVSLALAWILWKFYNYECLYSECFYGKYAYRRRQGNWFKIIL